MANNIDFIVKNGLQISSNLIVGTNYIGTTNPALNGAVIQGNVGIGTTNPTSNLHVVGTSNLVGNLRITNSAVQSGILFPDGTFQGTAAFYTPPGAPTNSIQYNSGGLFAGSTNLIWDPTNSRLGIGRSTPSYALDVAGTISSNYLITGNSWISGTETVQNLVANAAIQSLGSITANTQIANTSITSLGTINSQGAATFQSIQSNSTIVGTSITSTGAVNATGQASFGSIVSNSSLQTNTLQTNTSIVSLGPIQSTGTITTNALTANTSIYTPGAISANGLAQFQTIVSNSSILATTITSTGPISAVSQGTFGAVYSNTTIQSPVSITGNTLVGNLSITSLGTINSVGQAAFQSLISNSTVTGQNIYSSGTINSAGQTTVNALVANTNISTATLYASTAVQSPNLVTNAVVSNLSMLSFGTFNANGSAIVNSLYSNSFVTATNINSLITISAGGTATFGAVISNTSVFGTSVISNGSITGNTLISNLGIATPGTLTVAGQSTLNNIVANTTIQSLGSVTSNTIVANLNISTPGSLSVTGLTSVNNIVANTAIQSLGSVTSNTMVSNLSITGLGTINTQGTATFQTVVSNTTVLATGNITTLANAISNTVNTNAIVATGNVTVTGLTKSTALQSAATVLSGAATLTNQNFGQLIELTGGPYTVTLTNPVVSGGAWFEFYLNNSASTSITLSTPVGSFTGPSGTGTASLVLNSGLSSYITVMSDGTNWIVSNSINVNSVGNVSIGNVAATSPLTVAGNVKIANTAIQAGIIFPDNTYQTTAATLPVRQSFLTDGSNVTYTIAGGYIPSQLEVFVNGIKLDPTAVTVSNGANITLASVYPNGSTIDVVGQKTYSGYTGYTPPTTTGFGNMVLATSPTVFTPTIVGNLSISNQVTRSGIVFPDGSVQYSAMNTSPVRQTFSADGITNTFTVTGGYVPGQLDTYVNGIKLSNLDVDVSSGTNIITTVTYPSRAVIDVIGSKYYISTSAGLNLSGTSPGTPIINITNSATTGSQTATFTAVNKPGSTTTAPTKWIPIILDGTTYYIPAWT